jgi:starvation-inducible DNA-binding protein
MLETRHDLPEEKRTLLVGLLNSSLQDAVDLGTQVKQAHWNVRGPSFMALHELFDTITGIVRGFADEIAERAAALGGLASGTSRDAASGSRIPAYPVGITSGPEHAAAVADRLAAFTKSCRAAIEQSEEHGDAVTADLFTEIAREIDKQLWFVEAHLQADR